MKKDMVHITIKAIVPHKSCTVRFLGKIRKKNRISEILTMAHWIKYSRVMVYSHRTKFSRWSKGTVQRSTPIPFVSMPLSIIITEGIDMSTVAATVKSSQPSPATVKYLW
jgi:hypothetical protein